jgi:FAD/FMN-containing dehydrogenase
MKEGEMMSVVNTIGKSEIPAADELRQVMQGKVVVYGDEEYSRARQVWNGAVEHQPALFAMCENTSDVQAAVRSARAHELPLSVRGGGHDWAGRALRHDGLVVDLSKMRRVDVDPVTSVATIQGGATAVDVITAASAHGLVAATGNCGTIGMVGLTTGGGYGPLTPRYGLALDNLLSADVVLADGRRVHCDDRENPELFWALRGGGGNFGVVVSMRLRLHPVRDVVAGMILFPWSDAESVLRGYTAVIDSAPDQFSVMAGMLSAPDGSPVALLAPMWSGEDKRGEEFIARLKKLGTPVLEQVGRMSYRDWLGMSDSQVVAGRHCTSQTRWLAELTPGAISAIVVGGQQKTSPFSCIIIANFRGAASRVPLPSTAFGLRKEHFMVEIVSIWEPSAGDDGHIHEEWARSLSDNLAPHALPGGYPNMLGPDEYEQTAHAFGSNGGRLRRLKQIFDPDGVFTSAISLPLQKAA